ncbi:acyl-CoA dehydrogenase family protein [Pseudonocardia humida]|uniref:Acyl-CoA dehydrogenase family protein n=1 Tax=Pseudonocardia humida TaxID=2800819 RepID=A0ABT1A6F6_9PSEU|nr:acyl-CoA dehydrogenase family protein [Pseudonocardia humida]MCO1658602.1 acyl-CoA dehydrogenase family protein [Pseudonocardia humida]
MRLVLEAEQEDLRAAVRRLLADRSSPAAVREVMASERGDDPGLWKSLADLGLLGLVVPEDLGGAGGGHVERSVVLEELGRALTPTPFLASAVLATDALLAVDDAAARAELLPALAGGERVATVAVAEGGAAWDRSGGATTATERDGGWRLDGTKAPVPAGAVADVVLVYASTSDGPGWFAVDAGADGFTRTALTTLDPTRPMARLTFAGTPARRLAASDPAAALDLVADLAAVALAAEQVGVMARALELTVDYAKVRVQFGRPIGSYQAVKHGLADVYSAWEHSVSVLRYAAWTADHDRAELPLAAALAQTYVGPACFDAAVAMVQYHGGIGYTWEHDAHLFYKRAKSAQLLLGPPSSHRARLADRLGV